MHCTPRGAQASPEWAAAAFNEAIATFSADSTLYRPNAAAPHTCYAIESACAHNAHQLESRPPPPGSNGCTADESRSMLSAARFLGDVYDSKNGDDEGVSEGDDAFWRMYAVFANYPAGTGDYPLDEPWNATYTDLDARDGRGSFSYSLNYYSSYLINTSNARALNCSPP